MSDGNLKMSDDMAKNAASEGKKTRSKKHNHHPSVAVGKGDSLTEAMEKMRVSSKLLHRIV
jgi:hypothetical protein